MSGRHARRRPGRVRVRLASGVVVFVAASAAGVALATELGDVATAAPGGPLVAISAASVASDPAGVLDVEPHADLPGVTRPLPVAIPVNAPSGDASSTPGVTERVPVSRDWLQAWRDARERHETAEWLRATAGERDEEWQRQRGLLCDPATPRDPAIAHLCDD